MSTVEPPDGEAPLENPRPRSAPPTVDDPGAARSDALVDRDASANRYTLLEKLGAGGMGEVYAAYDRKLDRRVALKLLLRGNEHYQQRLFREAQAMARLSHPNVVAVFDTGTLDGKLFLAMEFVRGGTLKAYQRESRRARKDLLRIYLDAGRGLAAAHDAGLVHRDFKPDNVLVSDAGQVKVTDFGIARALGETSASGLDEERAVRLRAPDARASGEGSLETPMTEDGTMLGTPGYMAPEQCFCEAVDERTDQFSFCVSLYEALYGEKPFSGTSVTEIAEAMTSGTVRPAPKGAAVPPRIRRVLLRGLAIERAARYPSMKALLHDLARDPAQRRLRVAVAVGAAGIVAASAVVAARLASAREARLCSGSEAEVSEVWSPDVQRRIESALLATGVPYAADTWRRTRDLLDRYTTQWASAYEQTCKATRVQKVQTEPIMTVRMTCLEQRRDEVRALAQVLAAADRDVVSKAVQSAMALTPIDRCKDVVSLTALQPEPTGAPELAELGAIRKELATAKANLSAGKAAVARDRIEPLVGRARTLGYPPLLAEVLVASAEAKADTGVAEDACIAQGADAVFVADLGRADRTRAEAALDVMWWAMDVGRYDESERWSRVVEAALGRAGDDGRLRARWLETSGWLWEAKGRLDDSVASARAALDTARRAGSDARDLAEFERNLANELAATGKNDEAARMAEQADVAIASALGEEHPSRAKFLDARAYVAGAGNDYRRAFEFQEKAIGITERGAPEASTLAIDYTNACWELCCFGDYDRALGYCEKAVAANLRIAGPDSMSTSYSYRTTGDALAGLRRYEEAASSYARAIAIHEKTATEQEQNYVYALLGAGKVQLLLAKRREGTQLLERALAASEKVEMRTPQWQSTLADVRFSLAKALWSGGTRAPRVAELARAALEIDERGGRTEDARAVRAWLAERGLNAVP